MSPNAPGRPRIDVEKIIIAATAVTAPASKAAAIKASRLALQPTCSELRTQTFLRLCLKTNIPLQRRLITAAAGSGGNRRGQAVRTRAGIAVTTHTTAAAATTVADASATKRGHAQGSLGLLLFQLGHVRRNIRGWCCAIAKRSNNVTIHGCIDWGEEREARNKQ